MTGTLSGRPARRPGSGKAGSATVVAAVIAAAGALVAWKKATSERNAEAALWADATDPVD